MHLDRRAQRQASGETPTDHFKSLLEEAYRNHTYPVRHILKGCGMMRSFMTSGSLTWGVELIEDTGGSNTIPFPGENIVMMVYGGRPPSGEAPRV
jgi:hypothetical protein